MSKKPAARVGDTASGHDCHFPPTPAVEGSPNIFINGKPAVRVGDAYQPHGCPSCPAPPHARSLAKGSPTVFFNGRPAGRVGDPVDCGGTHSTGSGNVFIGDGGAFATTRPAPMTTGDFTPASETAPSSSSQQAATPSARPEQNVCAYCLKEIKNGTICKPEFKTIIRESIDSGNDINGVFKELCEFYVKHFDVWKKKYIDEMFSDLYDVVGKLYDSLDYEDKDRFLLLRSKQENTNFYGNRYSEDKTDSGYDKVQHIISGLWLGSNYMYSAGIVGAWTVEKIDTIKAIIGNITNTRQKHQIGFDWYDYSFTVAGAALGDLLVSSSDERCLNGLNLFASGDARFDSFYFPPELDYMGMGKIDPIFPIPGGNSEKVRKSLDAIFEKF